MTDPLSIAASVVGLLTAAQLVSVGIGKIISSKDSGSREIRDIKTTVDTLRSVLQQLQILLLSRAGFNPKRASLIMVDEVVATLTACVMTFSDLDGCIKGLESDEQLGLLDSVRWASKATDLKGYLQNLESHKTSLILITNILTCQSAHNAEAAAGELKVLMVSMIQTNQQLAQRMAMVERSMAPSTIVLDNNDSSSLMSQETIRDGTVIASINPNIHPAFGFAFDEDLQTSWVYKRSRARDSRAFSTASSSQLTQSWSILSGLSLSHVSNIAVQALPIFKEDLQNSNLYSFGDAGRIAPTTTDQKPLLAPPKHKRTISGGVLNWGSQIRSRMTQSGSKITLTKQTGTNVETITLPKGLRLLGRNPSTKKPISKLEISNPILLHTTYDEFSNETYAKPRLPEFSWDPKNSGNSTSPSTTVDTLDSEVKIDNRRFSGLFRSAMPIDDTDTNETAHESEGSGYSNRGYNVLWLAASLFEFNISTLKLEAGYPYLFYTAGEIFEVIGERGELWLARNQDDPSSEVGWLWSKHFAHLTMD